MLQFIARATRRTGKHEIWGVLKAFYEELNFIFQAQVGDKIERWLVRRKDRSSW
jgi:hypothetical protein